MGAGIWYFLGQTQTTAKVKVQSSEQLSNPTAARKGATSIANISMSVENW